MAARRVYVGRLPYDVRERDIERFFKTYGPVREVLIKDGFAFVEFDSLRDAEDAVRYMNGRDLKGERVHVEFARGPPRGGRGGGPGGRGGSGSRGGGGPGSRFRNNYSGRSGGDSASGGDRGRGGGVTYAEKYGPPRNTEYRVIIENLSSRVSWQDLKDFMRRAGEVTFADAHKRERNMGIVDFASYSDMKNAIDTLTGEELHGKRIRVVEDKSRRNYDRGSNNRGSRGGARSRSRSRSKSRSRSRSRSKSRSRSRSRGGARNNVSRSRSRTRSRSLSRSRGRQQKRQSRSRSRSRSRSKVKASASRSRSRSNSRSRSPISRSRSRSNSLTRRQQPQLHSSRKITSRSRSASRSRSRSPEDRRSRSRNGSPKQMRSRSRSDERQSNNHVHDSKQENNRSSASPDGHDGYDRIKKESNEHEDD